MKTNTKKKGNPAKKLIPAAGSLMVSAVMLATSTYAWFTMNKTVQVTGMEVKTKVGDNLLICTTNLDSDYSANTLIQVRKALLEPVSSVNGGTGSFFYTTDAKANGEKNVTTLTGSGAVPYVEYSESTAVKNDTAGKNGYDDAFNNAYALKSSGAFSTSTVGMTDSQTGAGYGYIDYTFYLKGTSNKADQQIVMSKCDIDYNGGALNQSGTAGVNIDRAWRVAVFSYDVTETNPGTGVYTTSDISASSSASTNQKGLLSISGAEYFDSKAVASTTSKSAIVNNASSAGGVVIGSVGDSTHPNATKYYKVIVRLWLEGEDTTCNSKTYAALTDKYTLDLQFDLVDNADKATKAVDNISTNTFNASTSGATQTSNIYDSGT